MQTLPKNVAEFRLVVAFPGHTIPANRPNILRTKFTCLYAMHVYRQLVCTGDGNAYHVFPGIVKPGIVGLTCL